MHLTRSQVTRTHMCARTHRHAHTRSHALIHVHLHGGAIAQLFLALLNHGTMEVVGGDEPEAEDGAAELAGRGGRGGQGRRGKR